MRAHESERACHPERRRREGPAGTSLFAAGDQRIGRRGVRAAWWSALRLESGPLTVGSNGRAVERSSLVIGSGRLRIVTDALARGRRLLIAGSGPLTVVTDALTRGRRFLIAESGGPIGVTVALACGRPPLIAGSGRLIRVTTALAGGRRPLIVGSALLTVATSSPAPAGPKSIAPVPAHARCDRKQVLRSRAFARSLRMTTPRGFRKRIEREGGVGAQHAAPLQFCLTPTKASDLELVSCLNSIKGSYRAELRDLFEAHFGRFEEKLERRLADLRVELHSTKADMLKWSVELWVPVTLAVIGLYFKR